MSTLVAQTISNGTVSTSSQNVIRGCAKAWILYNGNAGTITGSYNVTSLTVNTSGDWTVNFTNAMPNNTYAVALGASTQGAQIDGRQSAMAVYGSNALSTTSVRVVCYNTVGGQSASSPFQSVTIFSN